MPIVIRQVGDTPTVVNCYKNMQFVKLFDKIPTDQPTNRPTKRLSDTQTYIISKYNGRIT